MKAEILKDAELAAVLLVVFLGLIQFPQIIAFFPTSWGTLRPKDCRLASERRKRLQLFAIIMVFVFFLALAALDWHNSYLR